MPSIREPDKKLLDLMSPYSKEIQNIALDLRELVLENAPNSYELIYDSYNALSTAFSLSKDLKKAFCHIALYRKHVNLGFNYGSDLDDPENLLLGSGKHIRHLKIANVDDVNDPHITDFITKSIDYIRCKFPNEEDMADGRAIIKSASSNKRRPD